MLEDLKNTPSVLLDQALPDAEEIQRQVRLLGEGDPAKLAERLKSFQLQPTRRPRPARTSGELAVNFDLLGRVAEQTVYRHWLGVGDFVPDGTATTVFAGGNRSYINFPPLLVSTAMAYIPRPELWRDGYLGATVYYSMSGATAGQAVRLRMTRRTLVAGNNVGTGGTATNSDATVAVSAGTDVLAVHQAVEWTLAAPTEIVAIYVVRLGTNPADTAAAMDLQVHGVLLKWRPKKGMS